VGVSHQSIRNWIAGEVITPRFDVNGRYVLTPEEVEQLKRHWRESKPK